MGAESATNCFWRTRAPRVAPVAMAYAFDDISLALGGLRRIGKAAVLKTAAVKAAYRFESCALRSTGTTPRIPYGVHGGAVYQGAVAERLKAPVC